MAIYRAKEVAQMSDTELVENIDKLRNELIEQRGKVSAGGAPDNPGRIRLVRRTIARMMTEQRKRREDISSA
jgi:large subunit ribosomal protein L29